MDLLLNDASKRDGDPGEREITDSSRQEEFRLHPDKPKVSAKQRNLKLGKKMIVTAWCVFLRAKST